MAILPIVKPNLIQTSNLANVTIPQTEAWERLSERLGEVSEDNARSGFSDWGNHDLNLRVIAVEGFETTPSYNNMQGGNDTLFSNAGDDIAYGGSGNDELHGGGGWDELFGGSGTDKLFGDAGNDKLNGGSGNDELRGGLDMDQLFGGTGADVLYGGAGSDVLNGGADNDLLFGDGDGASLALSGRDILIGGFGNDTLVGGYGIDDLTGGAGSDTFLFQTSLDLGYGHTDVITDFSHAQGDVIDLRGIDAIQNQLFNQSFTYSDVPSDRAGDIWFGAVVNGSQHVYMNLDGERTALNPFQADIDLIVRFNDPGMTGLTQADFLF